MKQFVYIDKQDREYLGIISAKNEELSRERALHRWPWIEHQTPGRIAVEELDTPCDWDVSIITPAVLLEDHHKFDQKKMNDFLAKNEHPLLRQEINRHFAYGIPCAETIQIVKNYGPLLEVGAGTGWWAHLLSRVGADIIATDGDRPGEKNTYMQTIGRHHTVFEQDGWKAVKEYQGRNVLMVWPPAKDPMANSVAKGMSVGQRMLVVHEGRGGVIANDEFFDTIRFKFQEAAEIPLANYPRMRDRMFVYEKVKD